MLRLVCFRHDDIWTVCLVTAVGLGCLACAVEKVVVVHEVRWFQYLPARNLQAYIAVWTSKPAVDGRLEPSALADSCRP